MYFFLVPIQKALLHMRLLPLHNNPAELAARTMVQRRNISYGIQTSEGTDNANKSRFFYDFFRLLFMKY